MKALSIIFSLLAVILSDVMCAVVAFNYCDIWWGMQYRGYSAPPYVAYFMGIPYLIAIVVAVILAIVFKKKAIKQ